MNSQESSPAPQFKSNNASVLNILYVPTLTSIHGYWKKPKFWLYGPLLGKWCLWFLMIFNMLSRTVIIFLSRSKCPLILWMKSPSIVTLEPEKIKSITVSTFSISICHEVMGPYAMKLFLTLSIKPVFSLCYIQPVHSKGDQS